MAEKFIPNLNSEESKNNLPAELSSDANIIEYIQENNLEALKARFGEAEEDENIRSEGFELAKAGGLIRRPRRENVVPFYGETENPKEDIPTDNDSELSRVFDSAKSEHDNDNVTFGDLNIDKTSKEEDKEETEEKTEESEKLKKKSSPANKKSKTVVIDEDSDEEETQIVRKFNTHTKVIFVDESLEDGIKRNTDSELEGFFVNEEKGRKNKLWSRKKR